MSMLPLSERYSDFKFPPDPFPAELMKDSEITIGVPLYDNLTQYPVCRFGKEDETCKLDYAILVFTGEVAEPIEATMYLVADELNRTQLLQHWTITPDKQTHRITHTLDCVIYGDHRYLIHFHLKDGQKIDGYIHTCISVQ
jgi:hypothetical protein